MDQSTLRNRITDQFSYRGERADIWRAFDLLLDTDEFLNLGYSEWYQPHIVGSSQRRLVTEVGSRVSSHLSATDGVRLLDVGCGRGGPAIHLADRFGFRVTGLDLVPYNLKRATENARGKCVETDFVGGDATQLPFATDSFTACTAIDALVYLPDRNSVFAAVADVLEPEGVLVLSDLVVQSDVTETERRFVDSFADAWDMPSIGAVEQYTAGLEDANLELKTVENITNHSVGRFRKWTTLYLQLLGSPIRSLIERLLRAYDLDPTAITEQVRAAHRALPFLQHVILVAKAKPL
ncbi:MULTISPECIES: class I SAM-dependent methyltransferase [Halobacteriales]|jgi:ubiquinone/menaquinone biosynthesis C-methylase UbiE|uniref:Methyltransferase domain-containing protein n=1 Tax=Halogeometricum luteum TaxID=2950537 RepID=A0ABU2G7L4_9EURY|nr:MULTISPECIES: class I SAM-dependent methyltransferase [Halobacteria]MBP2252534.1 ubiquinone/menaquinone biosynthesis C-methylase UbiE [Halarchaeum solikamskense]MDS0296786.1 methyltransferase domain-containing protein [Halogeometricum sp. S3BR5-2]